MLRRRISLIGQNEQTRRAIEEHLGSHPTFLLKPFGTIGNTDITIFELDDTNLIRVLGEVRALLSKDQQAEVFLTASQMDPQTMLEAFRIGVKEYLPQPISRVDFDAALGRFQERQQARQPIKHEKIGTVISVLGAKGGIGTSTVAANLAICLKHAYRRKSVALVDLDPQQGDLSLFLDVASKQGLNDLFQDVSRLDETMLRSMMVTHSSDVHLLQSGCDGSSEHRLPPGCASHTVDLVRSLYDYTFVDCGHAFDDVSIEALEISATVIVITTLSLPVIRRTKHLLQALREGIGREKIVLAVNRYRPTDHNLLLHAEELLDQKPQWFIPNDYKTANSGLSHGQPLLIQAPHAPLTKWYLEAATALGKDAREARASANGKTRGWFSRFWAELAFAAKVL